MTVTLPHLSLSDWLGLLGLLVSVVGFGLTIWQLARTARASEATAAAIARTEARVSVNHLLVLLPQFRILESDLDSAAVEDDRRLAMRSLVAYTHIASEVCGLLRHQNNVDPVLIDRLQTSATTASQAKATLINEPARQTKSVTRAFRAELADVSSFIGGLVTTFTVRTGQ